MEEKLCVKWSDFHENINSSFANIRKDFEFTDVTLACEDGQQLEAHRVILAASSPFFQRLFRRNQHNHPLLYMRDVAFQDLVAIVDFLYCGEANIFQTNLDSFLALAEDLKLEGIIGGQKDANIAQSGREELPSTENRSCSNSDKTDQTELNTHYQSPSPMKKETLKEFLVETGITTLEEGQVKTRNNYFQDPPLVRQDLVELGKKVKSMMSRSEKRLYNGKQKAAICNVCGKEGASTGIRDHIEANHLEGVSLPCNFCGKTSSSRHALTMHILRKHKV